MTVTYSVPEGELTPAEIRRLREYWAQEDGASKDSAKKSKQSYFYWLGEKGLGWVVHKIFDWAWETIQRKLFA